MKRFFAVLNSWVLSLAFIAFALSCTQDKDDVVTSVTQYGITISNVVPTYNSVTFDLSADGALAIAYIAVEKGLSLTAQEIFDYGEAKGTVEGTFTYKGDGLNSECDYTLLVAAKFASGNTGPAKFNFTTAINTGAATSDQAAGIRVVDIGTASLSWEVTNGSDIDFSLTMVQPTILMENDCYEMSKMGISEYDYLVSIMSSEDYGYLLRETTGAEATAVYNYDEIYTSYPMYPAGNYTIYTLGCKGDYDDLSTIEALELTQLEVVTESITRIGNPFVEVTLKAQDYIGLWHTLTPNDDTKYWTKFFTQTSEIVEFVNRYDDLEGEGAGRQRMKEYIQQVDPYVLEQYGASDLYLNLDWGVEGIDFSRMALGFDANLVPGDDYDENIAQVLSVDSSVPDAEFEIKIDSIGASNFRMTTNMEANCKRVYWTMVAAGSYDAILADEALAKALAYTLDAEGWVEFRANEDGTEDYTTNINGDVDYTTRRFVWDQTPATEFDLIATGLNYSGGLSLPVIVASITTLPRTMGDYEPALTVTNDEGGVSKTSILVKYEVHDDYYEKDERIFYHRLIEASDDIFNYDDDAIREWLLEDNGYTNANCWTLVSTDSDFSDPLNYYFNWAGMSAGEQYRYIYCTENGKGEVSNVAMKEFTTLSNDGGENPSFTITVDPESITMTDGATNKFGVEAVVKPNADVVEFLTLYIEESVLKGYYFDTDDLDELHNALYIMLHAEGVPSVESVFMSNTSLDASGRVWLVAQGSGADGIESKLSYVEFEADGTIDEQQDIDIAECISSAPATSATSQQVIGSSPLTAERVVTSVNSREMVGAAAAVAPEAAAKRVITEQEAAQIRAKGVPFYTLSELTRKAILKEELRAK